MELLQSFFLGLLQGVTEFLPVSSSGHLALARALLGSNLEPGITFEIVVHFGSFCSTVVYYRQKVAEIVSDLFRSLTPEGLKSGRLTTDPNTRLVVIILLSMIPAMIVGLTMRDTIEAIFLNPLLISCMLIVTGSLLFSTRFVASPDKPVDARRGLLMGLAQAFAILPGISRSGSTISVGLFSGIDREQVANFSFLMVLPVLAGAMLIEGLEIYRNGIESAAVMSLGIGFLTSFLSGYIALTYLIILLKREKFHYFAYYCWAVGIAGILYFY